MTRAASGSAQAWISSALSAATDECLLWPYAVLRNGYGQFNNHGKSARIHRHICILAHGEPPATGMEAAHNCGHRACGNPRHLRWDTPKGNHADQVEHGTINRGSRHGHAKLTDKIVLAARISTRPASDLAREHGVSAATMRDAINGRTWGWLRDAT